MKLAPGNRPFALNTRPSVNKQCERGSSHPLASRASGRVPSQPGDRRTPRKTARHFLLA